MQARCSGGPWSMLAGGRRPATDVLVCDLTPALGCTRFSRAYGGLLPPAASLPPTHTVPPAAAAPPQTPFQLPFLHLLECVCSGALCQVLWVRSVRERCSWVGVDTACTHARVRQAEYTSAFGLQPGKSGCGGGCKWGRRKAVIPALAQARGQRACTCCWVHGAMQEAAVQGGGRSRAGGLFAGGCQKRFSRACARWCKKWGVAVQAPEGHSIRTADHSWEGGAFSAC